MERQIVSFRQDDLGDVLAVLACGHGQHVRHTPPLFERPWVLEPAGRARFIGYTLSCRLCNGDDIHAVIPVARQYERTRAARAALLPHHPAGVSRIKALEDKRGNALDAFDLCDS